MAGRTTVVISHNLLTVRDATRIVVLDQGRIVECGAHDDLLERGGTYEPGCNGPTPWSVPHQPGPRPPGRPLPCGVPAVRAAPPLAPGTRPVPGYEVLAHLARTGWLDVYDVWSEERDCRCVIKAVRPDRRDQEQLRATSCCVRGGGWEPSPIRTWSARTRRSSRRCRSSCWRR
ncbi:hypothetical protein SHIRM173S_01626 [Streptomyces hirsutus]